jgi:NAD+ diphosphatase
MRPLANIPTFWSGSMLVMTRDQHLLMHPDLGLVHKDLVMEGDTVVSVGIEDDCLYVLLASQNPALGSWVPLRPMLAAFPKVLAAWQWLSWSDRHQYCSTCGLALQVPTKLEKRCDCGQSFFPSLAPAVMVLVTQGREVLLVQHHRAPHFHTAIAGFVEVGECAEDAVQREVQEEVGLKIQNIRYFGTQSWPFPSSFMLAYQAEYVSGDIQLDGDELMAAKWFDVDALPVLPFSGSIARALIMAYVDAL